LGDPFPETRFFTSFREYYPEIGLQPIAADGSFEFPLVPPGSYIARVLPRPPDPSVYTERRVVTRDAEVSGVEISAASSVTGQIHDKAGAPAASIRVGAVEADPQIGAGTGTPYIARKTQTDADGRYRLDFLPSGRYYIQAGSPDSPSYFPGVAALTEARVVTVVAGETITNNDFRLVSAGVRITGQVTGIPPEAMRDSVRMMFLEGNQRIFSPEARSAPVGPNGAFQFSAIPPGTYGLTITGTVLLKSADPRHTGAAFGLSNGVALLRVNGQQDIEGLEVPFTKLISPADDGLASKMPVMEALNDLARSVNIPVDGMATIPVPAHAALPLFRVQADVDGLELHLPTAVSGRVITDEGATLSAGATILATRPPSALRDARATNNETMPVPLRVEPDGSFEFWVNGGEPTITLTAAPGYAITVAVGPRTFLDGVLPVDATLLKTPIEVRLRRLP
jgi:hypothetical protein